MPVVCLSPGGVAKPCASRPQLEPQARPVEGRDAHGFQNRGAKSALLLTILEVPFQFVPVSQVVGVRQRHTGVSLRDLLWSGAILESPDQQFCLRISLRGQLADRLSFPATLSRTASASQSILVA